MEHVVATAEGEWNSFNGMYSSSSTKEADFMAQLLGNCSLPNELNNNGSSVAWPVPLWNVNKVSAMDEASMYVTSDENATDMYYFSSSTHEGSYYPNESHEHVFVTNNPSMSMDYFMVDAKNTNVNLIEGDDFLNQDVSNDSMEPNENVPESAGVLGREQMHEMNVPESSDIAKKRSRLPVDVQKNKRSVKPKKKQRIGSSSAGNDDDHEEKIIAILRRQNSMMSCCSEDDDSNASQELDGRATSSSSSKGAGNGKTRANRGSATDPQSLYARKRRERINERLRILQSLVPNGTKVDISTMLEEAVLYVKFLQLQIKLLSSDDLWMYAPIAYNGMDIGLDLKIATAKS